MTFEQHFSEIQLYHMHLAAWHPIQSYTDFFWSALVGIKDKPARLRQPADVANDSKLDCPFGSGFCRFRDGGFPVDIVITVNFNFYYGREVGN